ncbi:DUF2268 domain-containing protein [Metabacillus arenae]|uniref:DUF2268 domain-containing protein n=1 Tax=Metabacillus arenae TaxID=2771434 RepID=A0A926S095_9BACI|nr:DUF2268 domain-containing protein [Metabacillus arenae]MBD1383042.1 DUF2268 domain-containing protein [Metabacillus arenae]
MSVLPTNNWLKTADRREDLLKKIYRYFPDRGEREVNHTLTSFGMFKTMNNVSDWLARAEEQGYWKTVKLEERRLIKEWDGPDTTVFILPNDHTNSVIQKEYNGKAGLAFHDKLFLFLSKDCKKKDIQAIITHEYNHVCRLARDPKDEKDYTLIDTIILEGMAENAVRVRLGEESVSPWASAYSDKQLTYFYKEIILPNDQLTRAERRFPQVMFGTGFYPKMVGYAVGYYIVKNFMKKEGATIKSLLTTKSEEIINSLML